MKKIFKTNDKKEALNLLLAEDMASALHEITYTIRRKYLKYGEYSEIEYELLEKVFNDIQDVVDAVKNDAFEN